MRSVFTRKKIEALGFICLLLYRLMIDWIYIAIISPYYSYMGFIDNRNTGYMLISWVLFMLFYLAIRSVLFFDNECISHVIVSLLYLLSFIPFTSIVYAGLVPLPLILFNSLYWIVLIITAKFVLYISKDRLPGIKVGATEISDGFVKIVGVLSLLIVLYVSGRYAHFRLNFNFGSVYDLRLEAREFGMPRLVTYLFSWTKVINTLMLAYCLIYKKRAMAVVYFLIQMFSFGIDGSKTTFFLPFIVLIAVKLYGNITTVQLKSFFFIGAACGSLLASMEYTLFHTITLAALFIRRLLFVPNLLNVYYFDFFTSNEPDYFRGSFLRLFGAVSPYSSAGGVSRMIGRVYYNSSKMNCNNGLFSDAFSNLGYIGVIVMPVLIVFFLNLFDRSTLKLDKRLVLVSALFISLNLLGTSFMTVLITHGFLLLILMTWVMKPKELRALGDLHL